MNAPPLVIDVDDPACGGGGRLGEKDYEAFIAEGSPESEYRLPDDEWQAIGPGYTSGRSCATLRRGGARLPRRSRRHPARGSNRLHAPSSFRSRPDCAEP